MLLVFPSAAPGNVVARGQTHVTSDCVACLCDKPADVPALNVEEDGCEQQPVFRRNHRRTTHVLETSDLPKRNLSAGGCRDEDVTERLWIGAVFGSVPDTNRKPLAPFDGRCKYRFADRVFHDLLHVRDTQAVPRSGIAIYGDVQVLAAGDLLRIDIACSGYRPETFGD
jgi:hypothetical protein